MVQGDNGLDFDDDEDYGEENQFQDYDSEGEDDDIDAALYG